MAFLAVPSLRRLCVVKVVRDIREFFQEGVRFEELGQYRFIVGPFEYLSSPCIEAIFHYLASNRALSAPWVSLLVVTHLRSVDLTSFPSAANATLFKTLLHRCKHLEKLAVPHCKRVPTRVMCVVLCQNPSLLHLDLSHKTTPKVEGSVVQTIARACRHLRVLKLADCQLDDPQDLLVLCGRRVASSPSEEGAEKDERREPLQLSTFEPLRKDERVNNTRVQRSQPGFVQCTRTFFKREANISSGDFRPSNRDSGQEMETQVGLHVENRAGYVPIYGANMEQSHGHKSSAQSNNEVACERRFEARWDVQVVPTTREEQENANSNLNLCQRRAGGMDEDGAGSGSEEGGRGGSDERTSEEEEEEEEEDGEEETDSPVLPLLTEDCSDEFGCLQLETLWLDYVTLDDRVAAELMKYLTGLRDFSLSDTNICNPWKLLNLEQAPHLHHLRHLDIHSTALSKAALRMIPSCHPDLQKLSISGTMLPPTTYADIGYLTGVTELELIGGQYYLSPPEEIFRLGIAPAIQAIGRHLCSLNLTYIAHLEFQVIPANCPRLEHLDLSYARVLVTLPSPSLGSHCPHLTHLLLSHCHIDVQEEGKDLEDGVLEKMIGQPRELEEVSLSGLNVSDATLKAVFPRAFHPLCLLNVANCKLPSIAGIEHVWDRCPYLDTVDLTNCREITQADFQRFQQKCFQERPRFKAEGRLYWR